MTEKAGHPVGESVEMRADHLRPWMDLLLARLEPGERILAQGRAFEPHRDSFELSQLISGPGCAAAQAIRMRLQAAGVLVGASRSLPKRERRREVP